MRPVVQMAEHVADVAALAFGQMRVPQDFFQGQFGPPQVVQLPVEFGLQQERFVVLAFFARQFRIYEPQRVMKLALAGGPAGRT